MDNLKKNLAYAKENISSFEKISVSSNEIYVFNFEYKKIHFENSVDDKK